jgi:hypothetical protein
MRGWIACSGWNARRGIGTGDLYGLVGMQLRSFGGV